MGPFDNDVAADWYGDLEGASPVQRIAALHSAVADVADHGDEGLTGAASEWHSLWAESPKYPLVRAELDELRDRLARQLPDR
jgi:hypothetical protein